MLCAAMRTWSPSWPMSSTTQSARAWSSVGINGPGAAANGQACTTRKDLAAIPIAPKGAPTPKGPWPAATRSALCARKDLAAKPSRPRALLHRRGRGLPQSVGARSARERTLPHNHRAQGRSYAEGRRAAPPTRRSALCARKDLAAKPSRPRALLRRRGRGLPQPVGARSARERTLPQNHRARGRSYAEGAVACRNP
jgi:hypothetical protein